MEYPRLQLRPVSRSTAVSTTMSTDTSTALSDHENASATSELFLPEEILQAVVHCADEAALCKLWCCSRTMRDVCDPLLKASMEERTLEVEPSLLPGDSTSTYIVFSS